MAARRSESRTLSDLIAMQPNLNIPLYLLAPDDRRYWVDRHQAWACSRSLKHWIFSNPPIRDITQ